MNNLRDIDEGTFTVDRYVGEIFINLVLGKEVSPNCGLDTTHMISEDHQ